MRSRLVRAFVLSLLAAGLGLVPSGSALADGEPDTTPPQINLNPCYDQPTCRLVRAELAGDLQPGDDLAVLGARMDGHVYEQVYDHGNGFVPYGNFWYYGNDSSVPVDYAVSIPVPRGTHDITFYARDLEGNTVELTTTVLGPIPPGPVHGLTAELLEPHAVTVAWLWPELNGSCCARYAVTSPGLHTKRTHSWAGVRNRPRVYYNWMPAGWHRFTVHAITEGGAGPTRSVRLYVPRQHRS